MISHIQEERRISQQKCCEKGYFSKFSFKIVKFVSYKILSCSVGLQFYLKETPSLIYFKDVGKFSSNFIWYIRDWKITEHHFIEQLLMTLLFGFKRILAADRSSRLEVFCKKDFLKNVAKFTGKHLYGRFPFNRVAAWKPETLSKKRPRPVNFAKFIKIPMFCSFESWSWKRH